MKTQAVSKFTEKMPALFEDIFKPWGEFFDGRLFGKEMKVPAVNIAERKDNYLLSLSAPGLKKNDFKIYNTVLVKNKIANRGKLK